jgi:hypothetical protein
MIMGFFKKFRIALKDEKRAHAFRKGLEAFNEGNLNEASLYFTEAEQLIDELLIEVEFMVDIKNLDSKEAKRSIEILKYQREMTEVFHDYSSGKYEDEEILNKVEEIQGRYPSVIQFLESRLNEIKEKHPIVYRTSGLKKLEEMYKDESSLSQSKTVEFLRSLREEFGDDIVRIKVTKEKKLLEEAIESLKINTDKSTLKTLYVDGDDSHLTSDIVTKYINDQMNREKTIKEIENLSGFINQIAETVLGKGWKPLEEDTAISNLFDTSISLDEINSSIADTIKIYETAKKRLDDKTRLSMAYVKNQETPTPLRQLIIDYIEDKITKEEAIKKLDELKKIKILYGMAIKDSIQNGKVEPILYFLNTAENHLYDKWLDLSKKIGGRDPTIEELLSAQKEAYEEFYDANRSVFAPVFMGEKKFKKWLEESFVKYQRDKENTYRTILPAYHTVIEKLGK